MQIRRVKMKEFLGINPDALGAVLKKHRQQHSLTQQKVAEKLGIERSTYAKYETGRKPEVDVLIRLASFYNMTIDELLSDFFKDSSENITPIAVINSPKSSGINDEDLLPLSENEIKLLLIYRNSIRKNVILEKAAEVLKMEEQMRFNED